MTARYRTSSAAATRELAAALAAHLEAGDVVVLSGDLGAGKTTFAQGIAAGLGIDGPVTSPSFTLVQEYDGILPLAHVDVYRLERIQELHDLGFAELLDGDGVTIVEWGDVVAPLLPPDHVVVRIDLGPAEDDREFVVELSGARWSRRGDVVGASLAPFADSRERTAGC